jgi:hypothetical protein
MIAQTPEMFRRGFFFRQNGAPVAYPTQILGRVERETAKIPNRTQGYRFFSRRKNPGLQPHADGLMALGSQ